ncbi:hypothetical protein E3P99_03256 [Wallemia hederae]|uniref:C2H2-type domain-containing protein n=1 Tax=Wallemia hederae TaxID=1540922 RepID=A0A4T0FGV1_9BASI|nr:hypothetical protein E3P99_03256 [Wallemia hederae]
MGKKRRIENKPWCWYCEREFEDDKVLISHQKAKHFRCTLCPRRLNTANGLAVHMQQVHKLEADRIENALPGRSTFEIEIFGMEGVPAPDRAEYERRRAEARGVDLNKKNAPSKRKRIFKGVISDADFYVQLQAHRHIMSGGKMLAPPAALPNQGAPPGAPAPLPTPAAAVPTPAIPTPGALGVTPPIPPVPSPGV